MNDTRLLLGKSAFRPRLAAGQEKEVDTDTKREVKTGLVMVVLVCVFCSAAFGQPWDGNGVEGDPYQIWTAADMQAIGASPGAWGAYFKLMSDINLGGYMGTSYNIIGSQILQDPRYIALDLSGKKMYWTDIDSHKTQRANLDGTEVEDLVTTGLVSPHGIALDVGNGKAYWTDYSSGKIQRANLDGTGVEDLVTGLDNPSGIALDLTGGKIYWTDIGTDKIQRANIDGTGIEDLVTTGVVWAVSIALDISSGKMYWTNFSSGKIQRANLDGTGVEDLVTGLGSSQGIALDTIEGKMYWTNYYDKIQRANLDGTEVEDLIATGLDRLYGIALDLVAGKMYWVESSKSKIQWANLDGTEVEDVIGKTFRGVFDGDGHTISNFTYDSNGVDYIGLFGHIEGEDARIQRLGLIDPNVSVGTGSIVGALVGYLRQSGVDGCYVQYGFVSGADSVGGLVGKSWDGSISNCYLTGSVEGNNGIGGLIGGNENQHSDIFNCNFTGNVSGASSVGGLAGGNSGRITGCYSTGSVTGGNRAGGLAGGNGYIISSCYSDANVSGYEYVGGLVASNWGGIYNSYSTGIVAGEYYVGGLVGNSHYEGFGIFNCYSEGSVTGVDSVGGLAGYNYGSSISECYSVGGVSGTTNVGGFLGYDDRIYINIYVGGFWDSDVNPDVNGIGNTTDPNVIGLPTAEMQTGSTFVDAGWDFTLPVWIIDEGNDYPRLWWEGPEPSYGGGAGTEEYPYLIYTSEHLNAIGRHVNGLQSYFRLCADIDMSDFAGTEFNVIGEGRYTSFMGVFDGNDHRISNFTYDSNGINYIGLFGHIDNQIAEVKNLGLIEPNIITGIGSAVGGLVGGIYRGTVTNCYVIGGKVAGDGWVGGLVGDNWGGEISSCYTTTCITGNLRLGGLAGRNNGEMSNCYSTGEVTGMDLVGGLVGSGSGEIQGCYSTGSVTGGASWVGGLIGRNSGDIQGSYSTGSVTGGYYVGGLVGSNGGYIRGYITSCYSMGSVTGENRVGGLVGYNDRGDIQWCYSAGSVAADSNVGGLVGYDSNGDYWASFWDSDVNPDVNGIGNGEDPNVIGKTTAQMQMESTFTSAGWDFVGETINGTEDFWDICDGMNYAKLAWQVPVLGDFGCPDGVDWIDLGVLCEEWLFEELSADVWPDGGDGFVDFLDWAIFADGWGDTYDIFDLADFAEQWLKSGSNYLITDIAPGSDGDGITNGVDFAALAENWLAGL